MKKRSIIVLTLLAGCFTNSFAQKGEKTLTVEVSNEWTQNKTDEPIVIEVSTSNPPLYGKVIKKFRPNWTI